MEASGDGPGSERADVLAPTVPLGGPPPPLPPPPPPSQGRDAAGALAEVAQRQPDSSTGQGGPGADLREGMSRWLSRWTRRKQRADELRARLVADTRLPLRRPIVIVVASSKGGVGKTTISGGIGEQLAALRAEQVAVLDAEPLGGTLGLRVNAQPGPGVPALLNDLGAVEADGSYTAWSRYATVEHSTRVTVFGRTRPLEGAELTIESYRRMISGLTRQWPIVVVDTGRPEGRDVLQAAAVNSADVLLVVCGAGKPTVDSVAGWLREVRVPRERRVGVVSAPAGGGSDRSQAYALLNWQCSAVVEIAHDPGLDADAPVPLLGRTRPATRDAFLSLAAAVMRASQAIRPEEHP